MLYIKKVTYVLDIELSARPIVYFYAIIELAVPILRLYVDLYQSLPTNTKRRRCCQQIEFSVNPLLTDMAKPFDDVIFIKFHFISPIRMS